MPFEKTITNAILSLLNRKQNSVAEKVQGTSAAAGRADINACYHGRTLRIEVKTPDNRNTASTRQIHNLDKWKKAGATVMIVYSLAAVQKFISVLDDNPFFIGRMEHKEKNNCTSYMEITEV